MIPFASRPDFIAAIDAGLRELERQGAVKLPRYCDMDGGMIQRGRCSKCGDRPA